MGVNIISNFCVMRVGLASQAFSQNPTLEASVSQKSTSDPNYNRHPNITPGAEAVQEKLLNMLV